jgi:hypothetical protein
MAMATSVFVLLAKANIASVFSPFKIQSTDIDFCKSLDDETFESPNHLESN